MKKISLLFKETSENLIKNNLKTSDSVFILKYSGVSSPALSLLRQSLRQAKANLFVVKNTVARRAFKNSPCEDLIRLIDGPCGLVFVRDEPVDTCKILSNFSRDHASLKLEGGLLKDKIIEKKDLERLSHLPSKEVLRAQAVAALNAPISKLVIALNQILKKLVYCLDQIKNKKGG